MIKIMDQWDTPLTSILIYHARAQDRIVAGPPADASSQSDDASLEAHVFTRASSHRGQGGTPTAFRLARDGPAARLDASFLLLP